MGYCTANVRFGVRADSRPRNGWVDIPPGNERLGVNGGSDDLAAQERRNIENVLLDRIVHWRGPAIRIEALRSRLAGIFRSRRCRSSFRLAGRRAQRRTIELRQWGTALGPVGNAKNVVA